MQLVRLLVAEVHNFGGFFGGDTVTLSGADWLEATQERTLTIDEAALVNVAHRHHISAGMLLELHLVGERVERARLLASGDHAGLRLALGAVVLQATLAEPLVLSYRCAACGLWVAGSVDAQDLCAVCGRVAGCR